MKFSLEERGLLEIMSEGLSLNMNMAALGVVCYAAGFGNT